ncbi:MAG: hypothetical protein ACRD2L_25125, partial [Terriglobia bacterium]
MLRNRQDIETNELKGVILAVDESKLKPGAFTRLSNWQPSGIYSIQKKRGCMLLNSPPVTTQEPVVDCTFLDEPSSEIPAVEFLVIASTVLESEPTHQVLVHLLHS